PDPPHYHSNRDHRNRAPGKSQWTITEVQEVRCFSHAWSNQWLDERVGWGLHLDDDGTPGDLGRSDDGERELWFAKFVADRPPWHGYPGDLKRRGRHDAPTRRVVTEWYRQGHIRKATFNKLIQGKQCAP